MDKSQLINDFATLAIQSGGWMEMDRVYLQNQLADLLHETAFNRETLVKNIPSEASVLIEELVKVACSNGAMTSSESLENYKTKLLDFLTPPPAVINAMFSQHFNDDPQVALDYFYNICLQNQQVRVPKTTRTENLTVPYPLNVKKIAMSSITDVPFVEGHRYCPVCSANEGYINREQQVFDRNMRLIRMNLLGDSWFFRFNPISFQRQQGIFIPEKHEHLNRRQLLSRAIQLVDVFSSYMIGFIDNAHTALEHSYLEGANQLFPIESAKNINLFDIIIFPTVKGRLLNWNHSSVSLTSAQPMDLLNAVDYFISKWISENNRDTPIAVAMRKNADLYTCYIIFMDYRLYETIGMIKQGFNQTINCFDALGTYTLDDEADSTTIIDVENPNHISTGILETFIKTL
ncbi:hypothetical protein ACWOAH_05270 [Vagococcus vulneris]|uniref:Galactose-1-phosphate uridyl transferase N-terminal domain-containing protein n=1 Tax=Vagococcus vulneris TaxID=1977869 RepID=A0A429ZZQ9_9ENTE|nr:hypothetical protein [Vagococcus vulneris]RST99514.1 hypothetical protein CBF37_04095 [Vagococcus vulneris]